MAALSPHTSMFSYSITRPYPFRWFTPTVFVVGILAAVLFSFINLVTSGYDMITITTSDPNTTIANATNFQNWPSFLTSKIRPTCEPQALTVNREYYTNNTALSYKVAGVSPNETTMETSYADIPYLNNPLRDCRVSQLTYNYQESNLYPYSWDISTQASVICAIDIDKGRKWLMLIAVWGGGTEFTRYTFFDRSEENKAIFWWAESMIAWSFPSLLYPYILEGARTEYKNSDGDFFMKKGLVLFLPVQEITEVNQYKSNTSWLQAEPKCYISPPENQLEALRLWNCSSGDYPYNFLHEQALDSDVLAKVFYSTVMADLGQSMLNILDNPELLEYFTAKSYHSMPSDKPSSISGLAQGPYTAANASQWNLRISPSVLVMTYLCQVPQLKSTRTLIFSVLIANLVLLQALWKIFILCTDFFVTRKHPEMNSCLGCQMNNTTTESNIELGEYNRLGQESTTEGLGNMRTESVANEIKIEERDRLVQEQSANKDSREELLRLD